MARKNVQKTTFEAAEMMLGPWNQHMGAKYLQHIYLLYLVNFRASWLYFGTDTGQPSSSAMALVILVKWVYCVCKVGKGSSNIEAFLHNDNTIDDIDI